MHSSMLLCQAERSPVVIQGAATVLEQQKSDMKLKLGGLELEVFFIEIHCGATGCSSHISFVHL